MGFYADLTTSIEAVSVDGGKEIVLKGLTGTQRVFAIGW